MRILVTAGPTREYIDPIRFISNRSTGKMGYAVAEAARSMGHEVCLISGPVALAAPIGVKLISVQSALEMLDAIQRNIAEADVLIMSAAVADWRPKVCADKKLKKHTMSSTLELVPNPDILSTIKPLKGDRVFVGFAAETDNVMVNAKDKLARKGLDMIVANDVTESGAGFGTETNIVTIITAQREQKYPKMSKFEVGKVIIEEIESICLLHSQTKV